LSQEIKLAPPIRQDTVGKLSTELSQKAPEAKDPIEQMRESLTDYDKNIWEAIERSKKVYPGDFYIVVLTKQERLMQNVFRNYFIDRSTCPTPDYDQTVYKYKRKKDQVVFMWVIPSRDTCFYLKDHALEVAPEERDLLKYVLAFEDQTLYKLCKELNGEQPDSNELVKPASKIIIP
jgi:hypothetical protein